MTDNSQHNKRIAKNTILLYFRMILTMLVTLYTSRVVLRVLGVDDFGIFNVVGGVVIMFSFLNSAMSSATQRFLSFELGKNNLQGFTRVFSMSINIHALIALIVFLLAETIGLWFVNTHLVIPADRMVAANWVYQCSILAFMVTIMSVPYNASIIAHERMGAFAYISILEVVLKLGIVFLLEWLAFDKLKLYAVLILLVAVIIRIVYSIYCKLKLQGCKYIWVKDKALFKQLSSFAGWNLWGNLAAVGMDQGVNILLNIFFGPIVNAARGIAYQVGAAVRMFYTNFQLAVNPQITKSYAAKDLDRTHMLMFQSSKYSFFLMLILSIPLLFETEFVLQLWLGQVPEYTVWFVRLVLISGLIDCLSGSLMAGAQASGRVKVYQSVVGGLLLLIAPISYIMLKYYESPLVPFVVAICFSVITLIVRLMIIYKLVNFSIGTFVKKVIIPCFCVILLSLPVFFLVSTCLTPSIWRFVIDLLLVLFIVPIMIWFVGMSKKEKDLLKNLVKKILKK